MSDTWCGLWKASCTFIVKPKRFVTKQFNSASLHFITLSLNNDMWAIFWKRNGPYGLQIGCQWMKAVTESPYHNSAITFMYWVLLMCLFKPSTPVRNVASPFRNPAVQLLRNLALITNLHASVGIIYSLCGGVWTETRYKVLQIFFQIHSIHSITYLLSTIENE